MSAQVIGAIVAGQPKTAPSNPIKWFHLAFAFIIVFAIIIYFREEIYTFSKGQRCLLGNLGFGSGCSNRPMPEDAL